MFTHTKAINYRRDTLFKMTLCVFKRVAKRDLGFNEHLPQADPKTLTMALMIDSGACFRH